jgi:signal transduction histidine kinase
MRNPLAAGKRRYSRKALPLRWRVAVAFALAAVLVTGLLGLGTWNLASNYMFDQRQQSAMGQLSANARLVAGYLRRHEATDPKAALLELEYDQEDTIALYADGRWFIDGPITNPAELAGLAHELTATRANVPMRKVVDGRPVLVTATTITPTVRRRDPPPGAVGKALYLELSSLNELEQTQQFLKTVLLAGIGASFLLGLILGRWAGRQALRPLAELSRTAELVASGDLSARLPEQGDADLAPLAATFNRTTAALEQRVAHDARFAGDVSHELRSPLTTMINAIAVLNRRQDELSPTARHALRLLTDDIERFHRMVIDLLEISRNLSGDEQELEPCDFAELVRHSIDARHESAPLHVDQPPPVVLADRRRLDRVVANLLDNAARHAGGAVRVAVLRNSGRARLEIDDAGPGIPVELRQQVFERFTRGNRNGNRGHDTGSGLGLALVAQHVRRHAGRVWIEDGPEGGARFVVELPLHTR